MNTNATRPAISTRPARDAATTLGQLLRFGLVGVGVNAALFAGYLVLVDHGVDPKLAMTAMYVAGLALGFVLHRQWSFASRGPARREWGPYLVVCIAGYLLNLAVLALCVDGLGWPHGWVQGAMVFVVAGVNFALNKAWVFRAPSP
jgi:putative flippase GtrA